MFKSKALTAGIAAAVLSSGLAATPASAATGTFASKTVHKAETLASSLHRYYTNVTPNGPEITPEFEARYNLTKDAIEEGWDVINEVSSPRIKRILRERLEMAVERQMRAAYYFDAVRYGEKLKRATNDFRAQYSETPSKEMQSAYFDLIDQTENYGKLVGKVYRSNVREAMGSEYILPAKVAYQLVGFDLTQFKYNLKADQAISDNDKEAALKMIEISEKLEEKDQEITNALLALFPNSAELKKDADKVEENIDPAIMEEIERLKEEIDAAFASFDLSILHSNDTHANVEKAPKRITAIKEMREAKENSLLLDAGDVFSGTLYFNEFKGQADLELMNLAGYDAMVYGNHEFDLGTEPLARFVEKAEFPFVSANVDFSNDANMKNLHSDTISEAPEDGKSYSAIVKEVNGEEVGIIGLTTAETATISSPGEGVKFEDYIAEAKKAVAELEGKGINKIVALTHIGYEDGGGDNDVTLAKEVEGLDVIVGGHSHTRLDEPVFDKTGEEPTVIVQAYQYSDFLGSLDVEFDYMGKVISHEGQLIDVSAKADDAEAMEIVNKYKPQIEEVKNEEVAETPVALDGARDNVRTKETNLGNLITDGMLAKAKTIDPDTVIALQNGGGIRASIDQGTITMGEILTVMPFGNSLAIMDLKGSEIKEALEHSVDTAPAQSGAFLQVAGMKFTYDSTKPAGERVTDVQVKGDGDAYAALDPEKMYKVATNTFTAAGGDNYTVFENAYGEGRVSEPGYVDWETFSEYVKTNPEIKEGGEGRITDAASQQ
ncbi:5'-nucleotidase C-terminal domain-containing protein [Metabacillus sp. 84]|uniref:5'-nucleotidase C-terminal domain-containing protein n=1 Tax=Metabacillus sp. 84 TaxID=3404705 RepID=UPI003CEE5E54